MKQARVLDLLCGVQCKAAAAIELRRKTQKVEYVTADVQTQQNRHAVIPQNFQHEHHVVSLAFHDHKEFAKQIQEIADGRVFDEIHLHMSEPYPYFVGGNVENLRALSTVLKPGGFIYHTMDNRSPLLMADLYDAAVAKNPRHSLKPEEQRFKAEKQIAKELVEKAGLKLTRFSRKKELMRDFRTDFKHPSEKAKKTFDRNAERHTRFSQYMTHALVIQKPR